MKEHMNTMQTVEEEDKQGSDYSHSSIDSEGLGEDHPVMVMKHSKKTSLTTEQRKEEEKRMKKKMTLIEKGGSLDMRKSLL